MASERGVNEFFCLEASNNATVVTARKTIINHNGCQDSVNQGSPSCDYMIVNLPQAVKPATKQMVDYGPDGSQVHYPKRMVDH